MVAVTISKSHARIPAARPETKHPGAPEKFPPASRGAHHRSAQAATLNDADHEMDGASAIRHPATSRPANELSKLLQRTSRGASGGRIPGRHDASIDFPDPGGPIINKLCPPAAAISNARFAVSCPLTSEISGSAAQLLVPEFRGWRRHDLRTLDVIDELQQIARRENIKPARPRRFAPTILRAD